MTTPDKHHNHEHFTDRHAWLRAAVLGANDGIISTACLLAGFVGAQANPDSLIFAGLAAIVAGSLSMAAGEAVSVASQADAEEAELRIEKAHIEAHPEFERKELTRIYESRGLNHELASQVATALMKHDALGAHARDELGLSEEHAAKPMVAAISSALSFLVGALIPFLGVLFPILLGASSVVQTSSLTASTLIALVVLGYTSAVLSKAPRKRAVVRIFSLGLAALAISLLLGEGAGKFL